MEEDDEDTDQEGGEAAGVRIFLQSHCPAGVFPQYGDVGGYPLHGTGPGFFLGPGGVATDGATSAAGANREVGVNLGGGRKIGGSV